MYSDVLLQFLEHENFAWSFWEATNTNLVKLIVFEEGLCSEQLPSHAIMHLLDDVVVPIFAHVRETAGEYYIPTLLAR